MGADQPSGMAFLSREARDVDNGVDGDDEDDDDLIPVRKRTRVQQQISDDDDDGYNIEDDIDQRKGNDSMAGREKIFLWRTTKGETVGCETPTPFEI